VRAIGVVAAGTPAERGLATTGATP
jgi:hypothetical protein